MKFWTVNDTSTGPDGNDAPGNGLVMVNVGRGTGGLIVIVTGVGMASGLTNSLSEAVANFTLT